jgi:hypothetical protein
MIKSNSNWDDASSVLGGLGIGKSDQSFYLITLAMAPNFRGAA